jgi:tetratricopeptide (TPR) repeat protein
VLRETGDLQSAGDELRRSVKELPDDAQGHHLLGTVLLKQNDLNGAISEFRTAIDLNPDLAEARALTCHKPCKKQEESRKRNKQAKNYAESTRSFQCWPVDDSGSNRL